MGSGVCARFGPVGGVVGALVEGGWLKWALGVGGGILGGGWRGPVLAGVEVTKGVDGMCVELGCG